MKNLLVISALLLFFTVSNVYGELNHVVIEIRPYLGSWLTLIDIIDTDTGRVYNRRFNSGHNPSVSEQEAFASIAKTRIQNELAYEANDMNLTSDEETLLEYYRGIKKDVILRIRQFPDATLPQAENYIVAKYPNSPFEFGKLYGIWKEMVAISTWTQFKTWIATHKFRGID